MTEADLVRRFFEFAWNQGDFTPGRRLFAAEFRHHDLVTGADTDLDGYFAAISAIRQRLERVEFEVHELIAEEGRVASRWTARAKVHGSRSAFDIHGMSIDHVQDDRISENWTVWDRYGLAAQAPDLIG
jgi:predicted ester cyclase